MNRIFRVVWSKAVQQWIVTSELGCHEGGTTSRIKPAGAPRLNRLAMLTLLALASPCAMAAVDIDNIGFETGTLEGWTASSSGTQLPTNYNANSGVGAAVTTGLQNFGAANGPHVWTVTPYQSYMASLQANPNSVEFTDAATALGLTSASQSQIAATIAGTPTTAAWLYQDLTLDAGDYFTMAWQYVSTDYEPFNDASVTSLVNLGDNSIFGTVNNQNAQYALLGATNTGTGSYSTGSYGSTGWQIATYQVSVAGTYRLGFLTFNLGDTAYSPILFIDQAPGLTYDKGVPFAPVAPNPGSGAPTTPSGPVVIDDSKNTDDLGSQTEASFEGGTLVVSNDDTTVTQHFYIDDKNGWIDAAGHDATFTGAIDDTTTGVPGSLTITNTGTGGTITLAATNGYTGTTTVDEGATLKLSGSGSIAQSSQTQVNGGLDITDASDDVSLKSLSGTGSVQLGHNGLNLTDSQGDFSGTIAGNGGVALTGGTQVLSGHNTYTGGTLIQQAVLQISSDDNLGAAEGTLTFDGGVLVSTGDVDSSRDVQLAGDGMFLTQPGTTFSSSGDVSGTGGLIKNGEGNLDLSGTLSHGGGTTVNEGTLVLSGHNTYTGGTTLNGGTLQISDDANLGDAANTLAFHGGTLATTADVTSARAVSLDGHGTLDTAAGSTLTLAGVVDGAGQLVKSGNGTLVLGSANAYSGGTAINGGTVVLGHAGALGSGAVELNGATLQSSVNAILAQPLTVTGASTFDVDAGTTTVLSGNLDGSQASGCFIKSGTGRLALTGSAVMANGTCVNEGILSVNGNLTSRVQVEHDGTLRGIGNVAGNVNVDGTLAAGNSPGTLTVSGSINMTANGTLQVDIDGYGTGTGAGNYSRVLLTGSDAVFVANGTLAPVLRGITGDASNTFTPKVGDMFRIVSGQGGVTGTFANVLQPTSGLAAGTRFQVYYITGYDIDLYVSPTSYREQLGDASGNVLATADALDALVQTNDSGTADQDQKDLLREVWARDAQALPATLATLTGENQAKLAALAQAGAHALAQDVAARLGDSALLSSAEVPVEQRLWANLGTSNLDVDADRYAGRLSGDQRRASAGVDVYRSYHLLWGAGLATTRSELDGTLDNQLDSDALMVYAAGRLGPVIVDGVVSYSSDDWKSERTDALGSGVLRGRASGSTRQASAGASLPFAAAGVRWTPSLRASWQQVERNGFQEQGNTLSALDVARYDEDGGRVQAGLAVGSLDADPLRNRLTWRVGVDAGINYGQARQADVLTALGGEQVLLHSADTRRFARAQLDGTLKLSASTYLYGGVSAEQGDGVDNNSVNLGLRIAL
ncbi:autotransporter-associated beta strand repeat-containing protein [Stenotrophomonas sp. HITSZ_GD]|uniref:autotransporter-associated beta strand repeat-containing protein n=1 Tax=Stenotrophomonas sp. HITSZ_GD TaxID=3037248 RepID=UPI00240D5B7E|nr:autotransporter-associated beta strand repeat-containing protein [Stenotrophomonas sp. HITSZ_GD]MDG2524907.1 autotransporter-associated beta strand repeat-containing protein [Stenotrophomonas sp. HITSZ_GD]